MTVIPRVSSQVFLDHTRSAPAAASDPWFLDPREIRGSIRARWYLFLLPTLLVPAITLAWLVLKPAQYAAWTQILIDPRALQIMDKEVNPQNQMNEATLLIVDSQMRVLTSDNVLRRVVERENLVADPEFNGQRFLAAFRASLDSLFGRSQEPTLPELTALRELRDRTSARRLERSFVIEMGVTSEDRAKSARLAEAVAQAYLEHDATTRTQAARRAGAGLAERLDTLRDAVRQAEDQAQAFKSQHNIVGTRGQLVSEQQLVQMNSELGAARARTAEQRARLEQINALARGGVPSDVIAEVVQSATITQLRSQLSEAESRQADQAAQLGPRHPAVAASAAQVRTMRKGIDDEVKRIAAAARNDFERAQASEASLAASLEGLKREAVGVGENFVRLRELERLLEATRGVYASFLSRTRELQEQQGLDTSNSRVISPASPPARRSGPPSYLVFAASILAGLGLGVGGAVIGDQIGGRVRSRRRLAQATGLPVLASLPSQRKAWAEGAKLPSAMVRMNPAAGIALGRLRARFRGQPAGGPPIILVTSADDAEGKSMLSLDLALWATFEGQRVLLIDADPEGVITRAIPTKPQKSLEQVIADRSPFCDALGQHASGLSVLRLGTGFPLSSAGNFVTAVLNPAKDFDLLVVDAGLLGAAIAAERLVTDPAISAIVVTAAASRSRIAEVERAVGLLGDDPRLALVLTDAGKAD